MSNLLNATNFLTNGLVHEEGHIVSTERTCTVFKDILKRTKAKSVFEIGFNYGHSALTWLSLNKDLKLFSVDIGKYNHTLVNLDKLKTMFGERFDFSVTNSSYLKPSDISDYDLFWIDGDHSDVMLSSDLNLGKDAKSKWILIDDYCYGIRSPGAIETSRPAKLVEHHLAKEDFPYSLVKVYHYDCSGGDSPMALLKRDDV